MKLGRLKLMTTYSPDFKIGVENLIARREAEQRKWNNSVARATLLAQMMAQEPIWENTLVEALNKTAPVNTNYAAHVVDHLYDIGVLVGIYGEFGRCQYNRKARR